MHRNSYKMFSVIVILALVIMALPIQSAGAARPLFANSATTVFINEIHYDNAGTDAGETIEIAGPAGTDLTGWSIVLYNGSGGAVYDTDVLSGIIPNQQGGYGTVVLIYPSNGIQNGSPDGIALVNASNTVVQFLSYEGTFTGVGGVANGVVSTDIGVSQVGTEALGSSLQLTGAGDNYGDFTWAGTATQTFGSPNTSQTFSSVAVNLSINDVSANEGNSGTTSFGFTVSLSAPAGAGGVTFDIATADNTATSPSDFTEGALTGQTIPAGSSSYNFSALVNGDTTAESDENFFVNVTNVTGATVVDGQGQGTILNDDGPVITPIHDIQGSGDTSSAGTYTVEAMVVGDYQDQGSGRLRGFFIQEEDSDADADPATSEGIFVFCTTCPVPVSVGDKVSVTGASSEFFGMSQLSASTVASVSVLSSGNPLPTAASIQLPVPGVPSGDLALATAAINTYFEAFEGMLVTFPDTLSVREYFELARYGQVILSEGGRPRQFTDANTPTAAGFIEHRINLASRTVILDDTDNRQNRPSDVPNTAYYHPVPGLSTSNFFRGGDTITNLTGVLHWSFAGQGGTDAWRIRPVTEAYSYAFTPVNTRPAVPSVGGSLKVASFNVLNYFLTVDTTSSNNVGTCGPSGTLDCRGADSAQELERQRTKMLSALAALDADVFGFMEMENTPGVEPLADIVAGLPGYAYIDTGAIGTDAIRLGIIYKTSTVQPVGNYAILDSSVDPRFIDTRNRPALAQTFEEIATGARFTVVVNHLKSKGSGCGAGDDDTTTGQGNCNGTRTQAAQALADWLATDPTASGDSDVLIIGDLNSYAKEDPIVALQNAGYTDLVAAFGGSSAYGYVFDGQLGYLDHALANSSLNSQVAGVAEWHINADEIPLFDYNDDARDAGEASFEEESDVHPLYEPNQFRTSDHDPVIVGLDLNAPPVATPDSAMVAKNSSVAIFALDNDFDYDGDTLTVVEYSQGSHGTVKYSMKNNNFRYTPTKGFHGTDSFTYTISDGQGHTATATVTITVD